MHTLKQEAAGLGGGWNTMQPCSLKFRQWHSFSGTRLVVTATDRGTPRLAGSATLTVIIIDLNDNSPMIPLPREIHVPEGKFTSLGELSPVILS